MEDQQNVTIEIPESDTTTPHSAAEPVNANPEEKMTYNEPGKTYADLNFPPGNTGSSENANQQNPIPQENKVDDAPNPAHEHDFCLIDEKNKLIKYCKCGESKQRHWGGRPSKYSQELLEKAREYVEGCIQPKNGGKPRVPYIEELSLLLGVDDDQIVNYAKDHEEFGEVYKKLKTAQKWRLMQRVVNGVNAVGCIFLLKSNYGMIETEKRIFAGGNGSEPLQIEFVPEKNIVIPKEEEN